jgi:tRNA A37 threonylcarbamoyladenosine dehydratase
MSDYLVKKICDKLDSLAEKDHKLIKESLRSLHTRRSEFLDNDNLAKLNLDLENYIINVIETVDHVKKLIVKIENNKYN